MSFSIKKQISLVIIVVGLILNPYRLFAAPPAGGYEPGETLNPDCAPGDADCIVTPLIAQDEGVDLAGNVLKLNFVGSGVSSAISSGVVTVTIPGGSGGLTSLNGLTGATQTFTIGSTGSDVNISSSGSIHTFNIPDAGISARGLVTTGTQTFAGAKTFASALTVNLGLSENLLLSGDFIGGEVGLYAGSQMIASYFPSNNFFNFGDGILRIDRSNEFVGIGSALGIEPDARLDVSNSGPNGAMKGKMGYVSPATLSFGVYAEQDGGSAVTGLSVWDDNNSRLYGLYSSDANANNYIAGRTTIGSNQIADASAILDISSTTLGLLMPRMTEAQRDAIGTPATGLMVYNTDTDAFNYYDGSVWGAIGGGSSLIGSTNTIDTETWLGFNAGGGAASAETTVFLGRNSGENATDAYGSVFVGGSAGQNATGALNAVFVGSSAGLGASVAESSIFIGGGAGQDASNAATSIFIGQGAGQNDTVNNVLVPGTSILIGNGTSTGGFSNSIALGTNAINTSANQLLVDDSYIYLSLRGINYELPTVDGSSGYVLTTNGTGVLSWQNVTGGGSPWLVTGSDTYYTDGSVGIGTNDPDNSSILDLTSTTLGLLMPRMTEAQRDAIGTPATGLMVYNTDGDAFNYYDGSSWRTVASALNLVNENYVDPGTYESLNPLAAIGENSVAIGNYGDSLYDTTTSGALGAKSVAIGLNALAQGTNSIAISTGYDDSTGQAIASGVASVSIGSSSIASGTASIALGRAISSGTNSFSAIYGQALGEQSIAIGDGVAYGNRSVILGDEAYAYSRSEIAMGNGVTSYIPEGGTTGEDPDDRQFIIGNTDVGAGDIFTILKNGQIGLDIDNFEANNPSDHAILHGNGAALTSGGVWTDASDITYKKDIINLPYGLDEVLELIPRKYTYKSNDEESVGFIAQELETIIPEVVYGTEGHKSVGYGQLTAVLTSAIQDLYQLITDFIDDIAERVQTEELCLGDTCITEVELQELLELQAEQNPTTQTQEVVEETNEGGEIINETASQESSEEQLVEEVLEENTEETVIEADEEQPAEEIEI